MQQELIDKAFQMEDEDLIRRMLNEIPTSPDHIGLRSILEMRWSMRNQKSGEATVKLTAELVKQTGRLAVGNIRFGFDLGSWGSR